MTRTAEINNRIRNLAATQHGLVARRQLRDAGVGADAIRSRLRRGDLLALTARVLRIAGAPVTGAADLMAAVLDGGPGAAVSHRSAAALWGLPGISPQRPDVTADRRRSTHRDATLAELHQPRRLVLRHVVELDGIPVTTPSRTIVDLASLPKMHAKRVERLLDTAWSRGLVCHASMKQVISDVCRRGRIGSTLLRGLLDDRPAGHNPPGSGAESRFQEIARAVGLNGFERQVNVGDDAGWVGRVDFIDRRRRLIIEVGCALFHGSLTDRRADGIRFERLRAAGFAVETFDANDLFHRRADVERRLRSLVASHPVQLAG